ncbi:MAG: molybdopterin oxidoreductase, partial [Acidobacteria bacterium]|nr:molybdopterin oxidoreductase [Acidobacteriota bacterium]
FLPFANGGFGTESGKCEFRADSLEYTPPVESRFGEEALRRQFPLELISPKNDDSMNSTFGNRARPDSQTALLHLHQDDAAARGIASGGPVRVFNDRGSCLLRAQVDESVPAGVVCAPSVRWGRSAPDRRNVNVLTSERLTDAGGGPTFYSCLVEVEKSGD